MLSRLWLFLAFVAAFGATKAHAEGAPDLLAVAVDQATVAKLPPAISTLVIGDPISADATMLKTGAAMVAVDSEGGVLLEEQFLQNGASRVSIPAIPIACRRRNLTTIRGASMTLAARFPAAAAPRWAAPAAASSGIRTDRRCAA
jgi:hypothetical protein